MRFWILKAIWSQCKQETADHSPHVKVMCFYSIYNIDIISLDVIQGLKLKEILILAILLLWMQNEKRRKYSTTLVIFDLVLANVYF